VPSPVVLSSVGAERGFGGGYSGSVNGDRTAVSFQAARDGDGA
jgi:hypothetical protein